MSPAGCRSIPLLLAMISLSLAYDTPHATLIDFNNLLVLPALSPTLHMPSHAPPFARAFQPRVATASAVSAPRRLCRRHRRVVPHVGLLSISSLRLQNAAATLTTCLRRRRPLQPHLTAVLDVGAPRDNVHRLRRLEGKPGRRSISQTPHRNSTSTVNPSQHHLCRLQPPHCRCPCPTQVAPPPSPASSPRDQARPPLHLRGSPPGVPFPHPNPSTTYHRASCSPATPPPSSRAAESPPSPSSRGVRRRRSLPPAASFRRLATR